jgi:hypothetical protein
LRFRLYDRPFIEKVDQFVGYSSTAVPVMIHGRNFLNVISLMIRAVGTTSNIPEYTWKFDEILF